MLYLKNISVLFDERLILDDISFELPKGDIMVILGESGSGKSTILNLLAGVIQPSKGYLIFDNNPIDTFNKGYVPQNLGLLPWKKVKDNIFLAQKINPNLAHSKKEAFAILRELGIDKLMNRYPAELSGGQKQRVALARLFVSHPDILLMDEPFSALDTFTADTSRTLFLNLWEKRKTTTIITTHNLEEAIQLGKQILIMKSEPGRISKIIQNPLFGKEMAHNEFEFFEFAQKIKALMAAERTRKTAFHEN
ncbi:MAG TPA: ATP-binding cassette domain-containing protein [Edaphocola sp.]|nr:ATP-binding cassette domain-containing protein [Edaphocola sp.]